MKNFLSTVIFLISFLFPLQAEELGDSAVWAGVYKFYNNNTSEAVDILSKARIDYPLNAAVHFTWASARWLHSQANDPIEKTYEVLNRDLDEVIPIYEDFVEDYPDNPLYKLYLGSSEGLRARVYLGQKHWFKTLIPAYKGFRITKEVVDDYPEIKDAYLPMGVVEYYAALRSALLKWAASLFGLETTKEAGLSKMEIAANEGNFAWIEARSLLSFIYLWEAPNYEKALEHSQILSTQFPKNFYFVLMHAESLIKTGNLDFAKNILEQLNNDVNSLTDMQKHHMSSYLDYVWGLYYFEKNDLVEALPYTEHAIQNYTAELDIYLTYSLLLLGNINDLNGDRKKAVQAYNDCVELDNNSEAVVRAKKYLKSKYTR